MNSPNSSILEGKELGLAAEPLRALRRGLARATGFALYVAVIGNPAQRNRLIALLGEAMPAVKLQTVTLSASSTDILEEAQKQLGGKPTGPVMIVGLEAVLPSDAKNHPILNALNLRRPDWPKFVPQPVVLWVPEYLLGLLARSAPDFLDWRSDTVHFPDLEPTQLQILDSSTWDRGMDTRMPADFRAERIRELQSRLTTNRESNDPLIQQTLVEWTNELGLHFLLLGKVKEALECFEQVLSSGRRRGDRLAEAAALGNISNGYLYLGEIEKAIECGQRASEINQKIGNRSGQGINLVSMGVMHARLGDYKKAIRDYEQGLEIIRETGDKRAESQALSNLGVAHMRTGNLRKAISFYEQALAMKRAIGDRKGEAGCLDNLGNIYGNLGDGRKALSFFEESLTIFREIGDRRGEANVLGNMGVVYKNLGEALKAQDCLQKCLELSREIGDRREEGGALLNLAVLANAAGDREKAVLYAGSAVNILQSIKDPNAEKARAVLGAVRN